MTSYSYCRNYGKDKVIFVTKEDHANPSTVELPPPPPTQGLITKEGEINWSCPCLGGMATGPCGVQFRDAFSCFHYSEADPKGSDCYDSFRKMQECFSMYPTVYNKTGGGDDDEETSLNIPAMDDIKENVIQEDVTQKNVIQENVIQENVIQEDITQENVIQEDDKEYKAITAEIPSQVIEKKSSDT